MKAKVVPAWSGEFVEFEGEGLGMLPIHIADERAHQAPTGWVLDGQYVAEDSEVFVYRRMDTGEW